jgi:methylated-DNA-protein-cysteine methyltransferase-like protein
MKKEREEKECGKKKVGKSFSERVVEAALSVPSGRVTTYGRLAKACGAGPMASQSITSILGRAWEGGEKNIPFHRIVYVNGRIWTSGERDVKRMKLYKKEGIEIDEKGRVKDFAERLFEFL